MYQLIGNLLAFAAIALIVLTFVWVVVTKPRPSRRANDVVSPRVVYALRPQRAVFRKSSGR